MPTLMKSKDDNYIPTPVNQNAGMVGEHELCSGRPDFTLLILHCSSIRQACSLQMRLQAGQTTSQCCPRNPAAQDRSWQRGPSMVPYATGAPVHDSTSELRLCEDQHPSPPRRLASWSVSSHRPSELRPAQHQNLVMFILSSVQLLLSSFRASLLEGNRCGATHENCVPPVHTADYARDLLLGPFQESVLQGRWLTYSRP